MFVMHDTRFCRLKPFLYVNLYHFYLIEESNGLASKILGHVILERWDRLLVLLNGSHGGMEWRQSP
jgi:hypothetical protein